jgi:hypothetical protein
MDLLHIATTCFLQIYLNRTPIYSQNLKGGSPFESLRPKAAWDSGLSLTSVQWNGYELMDLHFCSSFRPNQFEQGVFNSHGMSNSSICEAVKSRHNKVETV